MEKPSIGLRNQCRPKYCRIASHIAKYPKYSDKEACANTVDSEKTPQNAESHHGLHWSFYFAADILTTSPGSDIVLFKFYDKYGEE